MDLSSLIITICLLVQSVFPRPHQPEGKTEIRIMAQAVPLSLFLCSHWLSQNRLTLHRDPFQFLRMPRKRTFAPKHHTLPLIFLLFCSFPSLSDICGAVTAARPLRELLLVENPVTLVMCELRAWIGTLLVSHPTASPVPQFSKAMPQCTPNWTELLLLQGSQGGSLLPSLTYTCSRAGGRT